MLPRAQMYIFELHYESDTQIPTADALSRAPVWKSDPSTKALGTRIETVQIFVETIQDQGLCINEHSVKGVCFV